MPSGTPYEVLTQWIFQSILDQDTVNTIDVQHDVSLQSKTVSHQIDVYWKFEIGGIVYESVIQAKGWNSRVDQGKLIEFKGVLDDLPGQPRGIFVTRAGYQSGALDFANAHGIVLFELEQISSKEDPIQFTATTLGYVHVSFEAVSLVVNGVKKPGQTFKITGITYEPEFKGANIVVDPTAIPNNLEVRALPRIEAPPNEIELCDSEGRKISNMLKVYKEIVTTLPRGQCAPTKVEHVFTDPTYVRWQVTGSPLIKVQSVTATLSVSEKERREEFVRLPDMVQFVLRNRTEGTEQVVARRPSESVAPTTVTNMQIERGPLPQLPGNEGGPTK